MAEKRRDARPPTFRDLEHSPYTAEGKIVGAQRFAEGLRRAPRYRRVGLAMVLLVLLPIPIYLIQLVVKAIW